MKASRLRWLFCLYPPYLGAGVRVDRISPDFHEIDVSMKLTRWNKNYVGTHFGGSLYSMVDPFYMLIFMESLGSQYIVWDQAARIDFLRPGRSQVFAYFRLPEGLLDNVKAQAASGDAVRPELTVEVVDVDGEVIARVVKTLYVRLKPEYRPPVAAEISRPNQELH
jgi:acyl-coenzyme A thioesterase PaaI-like protein